MADIEKVIKGLEETEIMLKQAVDRGGDMAVMGAFKCLNNVADALALLKTPLRCRTCTMRDKTGFCHRWNREVKDDDYCSFGAWKGC